MKKIATTLSSIILMLLSVSCWKTTADNWSEGELTLAIDNYYSHGLASQESSPILAVSCKSANIRKEMESNPKFEFQALLNAGDNLYILYKEENNSWIVQGGRDTPQFYVNSTLKTTQKEDLEWYACYGFNYPNKAYPINSFLLNGTKGQYISGGKRTGLALSKKTIFTLSAGVFADPSSPKKWEDDDLLLRKISYETIMEETFPSLKQVGTALALDCGPSIEWIELEAKGKDLYAAWIKNKKIFFQKGSQENGFAKDEAKNLGKAEWIDLKVENTNLYLLIVAEEKATLFSISLADLTKKKEIFSKKKTIKGWLATNNGHPIIALLSKEKKLTVFSGNNMMIKKEVASGIEDVAMTTTKDTLWISAFIPSNSSIEDYPAGEIKTWKANLKYK